MDQIQEKFKAYLQHKMPQASQIEIASIARIYGGASRETFRVQLRWQEGGQPRARGVILRRESQAGLINTKSEVEFRAYDAFFRLGLPVPQALFLENDSRWLDRPFIVTAEITDCAPSNPMVPDQFGVHAEKVGEQFFSILGKIAAQDPKELGLLEVLEDVRPADAWRRELDYWEKEIADDSLTPHPISLAAIRWLRRNPPPPAQKTCVVHGDYRSGNFMTNADGEVKAILDWEMAHIGDPLEDLGWAFDPLWSANHPTIVGGMVERDKAIAIWEKASGMTVDRKALRWWELFNRVKGMGIWISAGKEYFSGASDEPILALAAWQPTSVDARMIMNMLVEIHEEAQA